MFHKNILQLIYVLPLKKEKNMKIKNSFKWYILIFGLVLNCSVLASSMSIKPFEATYLIQSHGFNAGKAKRILTINSSHQYQFMFKTSSHILFIHLKINEISKGIWKSYGPQPHAYSYYYTLFHKKHRTMTQFDWHQHIAKTIKDRHHYQTSIPQNVQDKLSYQLAMQQDLLKHKASLIYHIVGKRSIHLYQFKRIGLQTLHTPFGNIQTLKLQQITNKKKANIITLWLAPKYQYLLVKITDVKNGRIINEAILRSYK